MSYLHPLFFYLFSFFFTVLLFFLPQCSFFYDERIRAVGLDAFTDLVHDLGVDADKIITAHARLARNPGGNDHDISTRKGGVIIGATGVSVEPFNRGGLRDIQRLALGNTVLNIKQDNVTQFLESRQQCKRAANIAGTHQRNLISSHLKTSCKNVHAGGACHRVRTHQVKVLLTIRKRPWSGHSLADNTSIPPMYSA